MGPSQLSLATTLAQDLQGWQRAAQPSVVIPPRSVCDLAVRLLLPRRFHWRYRGQVADPGVASVNIRDLGHYSLQVGIVDMRT